MANRIPQFFHIRSGSEGFIIVTVLWMLAALSALVSIYAVYTTSSAAGFAEYDNRLRADALFSAALELTAYRQLNIPTQSRPTKGTFSFRLGQANVEVDFRSEAARIDLNNAPKQLLAGLFRNLGVPSENAENYSDRVVAWRTPSSGSGDGIDQAKGAPRKPKFPHVYELSFVPALPITLVERAMPFITVYSGKARVNFNDAAAEVIAALPGMTPDRVNAFMTRRRLHPDKTEELLQFLGTAEQYASNEGSSAFRVQSQIVFDNGRQAHSEVVILLFDQGDEPFSVLSWRDDLDGYRSVDQMRTRAQ